VVVVRDLQLVTVSHKARGVPKRILQPSCDFIAAAKLLKLGPANCALAAEDCAETARPDADAVTPDLARLPSLDVSTSRRAGRPPHWF